MTQSPIPIELAASVQHVETLERAISGLRDEVRHLDLARISTLEQLAGEVKRIADRDCWGPTRLLEVYEALRRPMFFTAWQGVGLPHHSQMRADVARLRQRGGA